MTGLPAASTARKAIATKADQPQKPKPISRKVRAAIDALVTGRAKTNTAAAEMAGLSREHLSRELSRPHIAQFLQDKVSRSLALSSARAGAVKTELLDCENAMVRDRASSFVLGLVGIKPETAPSASINIEIRAGYVIDLSEPDDKKVIDHG
jgi:hypothetical protein